MQGNPSTQHYLDDTKAELICALTSFNVGPCSFTHQEKACCEFKTFLPPHQRFLGLQIHRLYAKDSRCETQPMQTLYKKCRSSCWPRNRGNDLIFVRLRVSARFTHSGAANASLTLLKPFKSFSPSWQTYPDTTKDFVSAGTYLVRLVGQTLPS